jgi:hypothetical protein
MSVSGIGVQRILPRSGTAWRGTNPPRNRRNGDESDEAPASTSDRASPETDAGHVVDRNV